MIRTLAVELRRASARRLVKFVALASLGALAAIVIGVFATHHAQDATTFTEPSVATTFPGVERGPIPFEPRVKDQRFHYTQVLERGGTGGVLDATSSVFFAVIVVVGASLVGAEYRYGTMTTLLTWEPRRLRVIGAKALAAAVVGAVLYLVFHALLALALVPVAAARGTFAGADAAYAGGVATFVLRGTAVAGGLAALGVCLSTLGRNTSAALGGLFVYLIGAEAILRGQKPGWARWFVIDNISHFLTSHRPDSIPAGRSLLATGLLLAVYLAALLAVTFAVFTKRDVT